MNKSILSKFSTLFLGILLLFSCSSCEYADNLWGNSTVAQKEPTQSKYDVEPLIVLCHGLGALPDDLKDIEDYLKEAFPKSSTFKPWQIDTHGESIKEQSRKLSTAVKHYLRGEKRPIVLVGHSQGGLRAYRAALKLTAKGYTVAGVITIGTPWKGAPVLNSQSAIAEKMQSHEQISDRLKELSGGGPGVEDMRPGSTFLQKLHARLQKNEIPTLAIGGDISKLYASLEKIAPFGDFLDAMLGGRQHDLLLPIDSQLAHGLKARCFKTYTVPATHTQVPGLSKETSQLSNSEAKEKINEFIEECLNELSTSK